jgi:transcriptional regulator with XRE-family HTH domain
MARELREMRLEKGWTQQETAKKLGVSQGYWSFLEAGQRRPSARLSRRFAQVFGRVTPATAPPSLNDVVSHLSQLGYPGFQHLRSETARKRPEEVLVEALEHSSLEPRVAEALPWVAYEYADLDWAWLLDRVKRMDLQNRLGFVVTLARQLAERRGASLTAEKLHAVEELVERSRLVREDVFGRTSLTKAETEWLREHRPSLARHWNLLTNLTVENLHVA